MDSSALLTGKKINGIEYKSLETSQNEVKNIFIHRKFKNHVTIPRGVTFKIKKNICKTSTCNHIKSNLRTLRQT